MKKKYLFLLPIIPALLFILPNPFAQTYVCDLNVEYTGTFKSTPSDVYLTNFNISSYDDHDWRHKTFMIFRVPDVFFSVQNHFDPEYDTWVEIQVFLKGADGKEVSADQIAHFGFSTKNYPEQEFIGTVSFRDIEEGTYYVIIRSDTKIDNGYVWESDPIILVRK